MASRTLIKKLAFSPIFSPRILRPSFRLRPVTVSSFLRLPIASSGGGAYFSTTPASSSLNDPSPDPSIRPPGETIILDGCDFEHWFVVLEPPEASLTRDEIIDSYIKTLTEVLGSEEEAKKSIYSVSTKHYFAFGCIVSDELSYKIKTLPKVRWVIPDSYSDVGNKDYGGEPFIDGKAVPYDPKYHEEWARNNAIANKRSRDNDSPGNFDRSRDFERRRENGEAPPMPNQGFQASPPPPPHDATTPLPPQNATSPPPPPPPPHDATTPLPPQNATSPPPPHNATTPLPPPPPNAAYQNQMPNSNFQGSTSGYQGVDQGYQGGGNQGYQARNPGGSMPGGSGDQANNSYQGGGPGYQGGAPSYGDNNFQGGSASSYQGGGGGGGPVHGQTGGPSSFQGGAGPNFQTGGPAGPGYQGSPNYQADGPDYQATDLPGRDQ